MTALSLLEGESLEEAAEASRGSVQNSIFAVWIIKPVSECAIRVCSRPVGILPWIWSSADAVNGSARRYPPAKKARIALSSSGPTFSTSSSLSNRMGVRSCNSGLRPVNHAWTTRG